MDNLDQLSRQLMLPRQLVNHKKYVDHNETKQGNHLPLHPINHQRQNKQHESNFNMANKHTKNHEQPLFTKNPRYSQQPAYSQPEYGSPGRSKERHYSSNLTNQYMGNEVNHAQGYNMGLVQQEEPDNR